MKSASLHFTAVMSALVLGCRFLPRELGTMRGLPFASKNIFLRVAWHTRRHVSERSTEQNRLLPTIVMA
jgi:hypothetical protein